MAAYAFYWLNRRMYHSTPESMTPEFQVRKGVSKQGNTVLLEVHFRRDFSHAHVPLTM